MAKQFLTDIDLAQGEIRNAVIQRLASAPASPVAGQFYMNTTDNTLYIYNGAAWIPQDQQTAEEILAALLQVDGASSNLDADRLDGQEGAWYRDRANHTGTQGSATIGGVATDRLLGRDTAGSGTAEEIQVTGGLAFTGSGGIQTAAFTGDVTKAAGGTVQTIANDAVTNVKLANMPANTLKGNNAGASADPADLTPAQVKALIAILHTDISDFDTGVRENRLDQMATPTGNVSMGSQRITNLATPTGANDAATKGYVDSVAIGLDPKDSVLAASTGNATLSGLDAAQFDYNQGGAFAGGERILVKNQTTPSQNGIYTVSSGAWTRTADAVPGTTLTTGAYVFVDASTAAGVNAGTGWTLNAAGVWVQFSGATPVTAGSGLFNNGNVYNVGAGEGIVADADAIRVDTAVVVRKYAANVPASTSPTFTHGFGTRDVTVQVFRSSSPYDQVEVDIEATNNNTVTLRFAQAPAANAYRVVIHG